MSSFISNNQTVTSITSDKMTTYTFTQDEYKKYNNYQQKNRSIVMRDFIFSAITCLVFIWIYSVFSHN